MAKWTFLSSHGRVLLCIAEDPEVRLRDLADRLEITERSAYAIVNNLVEDGYIIKVKDEDDARRNRYQIEDHLPLPEIRDREQAIGDVLKILNRSSRRKNVKVAVSR
jgi:predicted transcriptional regulator